MPYIGGMQLVVVFIDNCLLLGGIPKEEFLF